MIEIVPYDEIYEMDIHEMLVHIEAEFEQPIRDLSKKTIRKLPDKYWLALKNKEVVGTVGLIFIQPQNAILKSMMVRKDCRGRTEGLSQLLLQKAMDCCIKKGVETIYLGTMPQFKAAQKFYQKNGFKELEDKRLPENFLGNPLDKIFFYKKIKATNDSINE